MGFATVSLTKRPLTAAASGSKGSDLLSKLSGKKATSDNSDKLNEIKEKTKGKKSLLSSLPV